MIIKEMTMHDGKQYTIGIKEIISTSGGIVECHILEKSLLGHKTIFKKEHWRGLSPDYKQMAFFTICDYEHELELKEKLNNSTW